MKRTGLPAIISILSVLSLLLSSLMAVPVTAETSPEDEDHGAVDSKISPSLALRVQMKLQAEKENLSDENSSGVLDNLSLEKNSDINFETVFLHLAEEPSEDQIKDLEALGVTVYPDSWVPPVGEFENGYLLAKMPVNQLEPVAALDYVVSLSSGELLAQKKNDAAREKMGVDEIWTGGDTGEGVTVAVLDSGIDTSSNDLPELNEDNSKDYSSYPDSLDDTINNTVTGHGTHVAGIVLGQGNNSQTYTGMAPGANLVFLKIGRDSDSNATYAAITGAIIAAVDTYQADIITMSYGGWSTWHDGTDENCQAVDYAVSQGVTVFMAAGNEASDGWHYSGTVAANSYSDYIPVTIESDSSELYMGLVWYDGESESNTLRLRYYDADYHLLSPENSDQSESTRGTEAIEYAMDTGEELEAGTYYLRVRNYSASSQFFHIYYYGGLSTVYFDNPDPAYTLSSPAEADGAIAVGAYTTRYTWTDYLGNTHSYSGVTDADSIAYFSSQGPRVDEDAPVKPDITAPGQGLVSIRDNDVYPCPEYNENADMYPYESRVIDNDGLNLDGSGAADYLIMRGTSMATPAAAGVAALLLSYDSSLTPEEVKQILQATAVDKGEAGDDYIYGGGLINIAAALQSLQKLSFTSSPLTAAAGAVSGPVTIQAQSCSDSSAVDVKADTVINLTSTSTSGSFSLSDVDWVDITTVTIPAGSNAVSFYYQDTVAGTPIITAASALFTGAGQTETVTPGAASQIGVETDASGTGTVVPAQEVISGSSLTVYAVARDQYGNFVSNAAGTWSLTNIVPNAAAADLVPAGDNLSAVFTGHLVGSAQIRVESDSLTSVDSGIITVVVQTASQLAVSGYPSSVRTGKTNTFTVTAQDRNGNTVTDYTGTVHFTSTDSQAVLPADYTFVSGDNGTHQFTAALKTTGTQSITATDTTDSGITGTQADITVKKASSGSGGGGGGSGSSYTTVTTTGMTPSTTLKLNSSGLSLLTVKLSLEDEGAVLKATKGTKMTNAKGNLLTSLAAEKLSAYPDLPAGTRALLAYEFGPEGAQFDPELTLTLPYQESDLEVGGTLYLGSWDGSQWTALESVIDTKARTVSASISHFSTYALLEDVPVAEFTLTDFRISGSEVAIGKEVSIGMMVTNSGNSAGEYEAVLKINDIETESKKVTLEAGESQTVEFTVTGDQPGTYDIEIGGQEGSYEVYKPLETTPEATLTPLTENKMETPTATPAAAATTPVVPLTTSAAAAPTGSEVAAKSNTGWIWAIVSILVAAGLILGVVISRRKK